MKSKKWAKILPRNQHVLPTIIVDPITDARYSRTEVGFFQIPEMEHLFHAPDFRPPSRWSEFNLDSPYWDEHFLKVFGPEYMGHKNNPERKDAFIDPKTQSWIMGKSYARKLIAGKPDIYGIIAWGHWATIESCWFIINRDEAIWLRSEEEIGFKHGA